MTLSLIEVCEERVMTPINRKTLLQCDRKPGHKGTHYDKKNSYWFGKTSRGWEWYEGNGPSSSGDKIFYS